MKYISTRADNAKTAEKTTLSAYRTFSEILLEGLAPDGGLYLPEKYPTVSDGELNAWRSLSYADLAFEILKKYATDIPQDDLKAIAHKTYTPQVYCHARTPQDAEKITPLYTLEKNGNKTIKILSLSNGPSLAFKDMAMQLLGNLFEYALAKKNTTLNIFGATSGDTGSSAEYAMRGKRGIRVFMLSPHNKMSAFQTAQMFSLQDKNIFNIAVKGVFDDCQDMVKAVSNDLDFKAKHKIGTVNSINWARVVAQVIYYFRGYLSATTDNSQKVSFTVPSGNFGNICAGHIARMMGLPVDELIVATNENDVLDEFFRTGVYRVRKSAETFHTSSPSMDISKASNFERFVYDLTDRDGSRVRSLFEKINTHGGFDLSGKAGSDGTEFQKVPRFGFSSGKSTHADRIATIRDVYKKSDVIIDPHTADGVKVAREHVKDNVPMIVLETALPVKFNETIREALGREAPRPKGFENIESSVLRFDVMSASVDEVKNYIDERTKD